MGGVLFDVIVKPSAAASAHDLGLAGRPFAACWGGGVVLFALVRSLSCC